MSGFCRFPDSTGNSHRHCQATWVTPSAEVTCVCQCHNRARVNGKVAKVLVPKGQSVTTGAHGKRLVPKK